MTDSGQQTRGKAAGGRPATIGGWVLAAVCGALFARAAEVELAVVRGSALQSSNFSGTQYLAAWGLDDDPATFTHTADIPNSYWEEDLCDSLRIERIELVNRHNAVPERLGGLTLRVFDANRVSVLSATVTNPGLGGTWTFDVPGLTTGRYVRVGLENGVTNQGGNYYVTLAEVRVHAWVPVPAGTNVALGKDAFMTRLTDTLLPATNAVDGNLSTAVFTTTQTVDGYWEVDLGALYALDRIRALEGDGLGGRLAHATVRLFDEAHRSVFSRHLALTDVPLFTVELGSPHVARYVRVGLENKERTSPTGGTEWWLGFKEVQVYGRPADEVGLLEFGASRTNLAAGQSSTLTWRAEGVLEVLLTDGAGLVTNVTGLAALTVTPAGPACYTLLATNACRSYERSLALTVDGASPALRIEEFVADNEVSFEDGYGDAPDWIEIRNPSGQDLPLLGYGLSDNPSKPFKWRFPEVTVPAYGRLVVCASGRPEAFDAEGRVHADWSLAAGGEHLVLSAPDGARLDEVLAYPPQGEDVAYARGLDGLWGFQAPTPDAPNRGPRYAGWLKKPDFSQTRGFYDAPFTLALTDPNAGSTLLVSTDGTEPSAAYAGPLTIDRTCAVRARVARAGYHAPRTRTHTYVFVDAVVTSPVMRTVITQDPRYSAQVRQGLLDLPTVAVAVPEIRDDYFEREASVEVLWPQGGEAVQANCGFEQFGGSWQEFAKKSWRLNFRKAFGAERLEAPLLNGFDRGFPVRERFNTLELRSGSQDMVARGFYLSGRFVEDAMLDMGSLNPHGRFVNLYLNGVYWGQYDLREALDDAFLADYLGGGSSDYLVVRGNDNVGDAFVTGTPDPVNRQSWTRARELATSYAAARDYVDVAGLTDFMLLWNYGNCESEFRSAGTVEAGSGFTFWLADADGFLRSSALGLNRTGRAGPGDLFGRLRSGGDPDFAMLVADRIQRHFFNGGALTPARNEARLGARLAEISNSLVTECARWGYRTPENWLAAAEEVRTNLFVFRTAQLFGYLRSAGLYPAFDPPVLSQQGGMVTNGTPLTLGSSAGTVYYTLDGTDPRLPGGGIAPGARVFDAGGSAQALVASNAVWRYWDRGGLAGDAWRGVAFDDAAWNAGAAELGYGDGQVTAIGYGPNASSKYITSYFRTTFVADEAAASADRLHLHLLRDDGAVVYLNGVELLRDNMPAGSVDSNTLASVAVGGADESRYYAFDLPAAGLVSGTNALAVEIHQSSGSSSDLSFNLALSAWRTLPSEPVPLVSNTLVRARVWTGTAWSALNEAAFHLPGREPASASNLLVTEIHYDPPGSADDEAFVELMNAGTNEVDLSGAALAEAVSFVFPGGTLLAPGAFICVAEDAAAFAAAYQQPSSAWHHAGVRLAGEWAGALATGGETLRLVASNGAAIASVPYAPDGEWPSRAAGRGSSLELAAPLGLPRAQPALDAALAQPAAWRSSSLYQGSPGRLDTGRRALVINEALAHTDADEDWVELYNAGAAVEDLTGLCLSDDWGLPFRYAIPAETEVAAGGYARFTRAQLGFGLSEGGSDVLLVERQGDRVVRFLDTVDFPASAREETFGRYRRSDGETDFTELRAATPGGTNALPRVGPVVIGELLVDPAPDGCEYAVLVNLGAEAVPLYDTNRAENVWELADAVRFRFPPFQVLAPRGLAVVCATNEAAFRARVALDPAIPVYGPWEGRLDNAGETLKLLRPGDPEPDGGVPLYRADRVAYRTAAPWPALTAGVSLVRAPLEGYGSDPANWRPAAAGAPPGGFARNRAPALRLEGPAALDEGSPLTLAVAATDPDEPWQRLALTLEAGPPGAQFDAAGGACAWTPGEADGPGLFAFRFCARDDGWPPFAATQTVWVSVAEVNQAPWLEAADSFAYPAGAAFDWTPAAGDADLPPQPLRYAQSGLPPGLALDEWTGRIAGRGAVEGVYAVSVVVSDGQVPPLAATNAFTLTLTEPLALRVEGPRAGVDGPLLSVPTLAGEAYRMEVSERLDPPEWRELVTLPAAPSNVWQVADPAATNRAQRFYRLLWLR